MSRYAATARVRAPRLSGWTRRWLIGSAVIMWVSGAAWLVLHYFFQRADEFGPEPHALEPWMLRLHGLVLIPMLLALGSMAFDHIPAGWRDRSRRSVGLLLAAVMGFLVSGGYLLYYVGNDIVREWAAWSHWIVGLLSPAPFLWHYLSRAARPGTAA